LVKGIYKEVFESWKVLRALLRKLLSVLMLFRLYVYWSLGGELLW